LKSEGRLKVRLSGAARAPGADLHDLRQQINSLDAQTEHIGVPLSFSNELYDLRGHVHMVRKRIQPRAADSSPPPGTINTPVESTP